MTSLVKNGKYFGHVTITSGHKDQPMDTADSQWANCTTWWQLINYKVQILHWSIPSFIFCPSPPTSNLPSIWTFEVFKSYPPSPPPKIVFKSLTQFFRKRQNQQQWPSSLDHPLYINDSQKPLGCLEKEGEEGSWSFELLAHYCMSQRLGLATLNEEDEILHTLDNSAEGKSLKIFTKIYTFLINFLDMALGCIEA